jgi:hypothetical protein
MMDVASNIPLGQGEQLEEGQEGRNKESRA